MIIRHEISRSACIKAQGKIPATWRKITFGCLGLFLFVFSTLLNSCHSSGNNKEKPLFLKEDPAQTKITFVNRLQDTDKLNILDYLYYYNGAGVGAGDLNNDGFTDLYFVSNQEKNKLYLNNGNEKAGSFTFREVAVEAGVDGKADWQTGVSMADVNGDGWLDIYVCAVGDYKGLKGKNELYINNGVDANGQLSFTESAAEYGLDFSGFSTQAAFFDYDKDGDLDMYLLNHAVHTSQSYKQASTRNIPDKKAGDHLFQNQLTESGNTGISATVAKFRDVSQEAGIFQAVMGYGLGVVIADMNNDGWDDIYVANDFHEDDYYYVNNQDGTFTESGKNYFRHFSRFSMGCDAADMNNDGFQDLITLDMYPEDETVLKSSAGEDPFDIFQYKLTYGYFYQYSRNCLQLNLSGKGFSDVGAMAGVTATDWSWSPLIADYDNDGVKDLFIANGIVRRPNDLDYIKYVSSVYNLPNQEKSKTLDKKAIAQMPEGNVSNYLYKGNKDLKFEDKSKEWGFKEPSLSNGAVYADLDNDGDLDLITNNINEPAGIYRNTSERLTGNNFLKIRLKGEGGNTFGVGARVILKNKGQVQVQQLMPVRGFLSSVEPVLTFGIGRNTQIDCLIVIWANNKMEIKELVQANSVLTLEQKNARKGEFILEEKLPKQAPRLVEATSDYALEYTHQENKYYDFYRESLMPFQLSTEGPKIAVGDVNGDGRDDFYVSGAKGQAGKLFVQQDGGSFLSYNELVFGADSLYEDTDAVFFDMDGDGDLDLYVVSGGNEYYGKSEFLKDRLYLNDGMGNFSCTHGNLPVMYSNKSCVRPFDFDQDGDLDLFVGGRVEGNKYGHIPDSYLLINDGTGKFSDQTAQLAPALRKAGMITDAHWADFDQDGDHDLIVVGDWMPIRIFENKGYALEEASGVAGLEQSNGLWQSIQGADFDKDGDTDFVVGNLGTNTKLKKGNGPLKLYVKDIDQNNMLDHLLTYQLDGKWYPVATKDELGKQMPFINKKFNSYKSFAGKTLEEVFDQGELKGAKVLEVNQFKSIYLENLGSGSFKQHALPGEAQVSKIFAFHVEDLDEDGILDVLLGGNLYGVSTYQGRYDSSYGLVLQGNGKGSFKSMPVENGFILEGEVRDIHRILVNQEEVYLVARNNLPIQVFRKQVQIVKAPEKKLSVHSNEMEDKREISLNASGE